MPEPQLPKLAQSGRVVADVLLGNGDNHLKNRSFRFPVPGEVRLSPAYDIVLTVLFIPRDELALRFVRDAARLHGRQWGALLPSGDAPAAVLPSSERRLRAAVVTRARMRTLPPMSEGFLRPLAGLPL